MNMFIIFTVVMVSWVYDVMNSQTHQIVYVKCVVFFVFVFVYQVYINKAVGKKKSFLHSRQK